jgi:FlaA1/EpsC-like NDP-sugar epimerase
MVLEMGDQVKIVDVAQTLIRMSGRRDIDVVYTGLRPGEKLAEELFSTDEQADGTEHELVSRVDVPALDAASVRTHHFTSGDAAAQWMRQASQPTSRSLTVA